MHPAQYQILLIKLALLARMGALLLLALTFALLAHTQTKTLLYNIRQNGKLIGNMQVKEVATAGKVSLLLQSQVLTRFVMEFAIRVHEEAHYENNILVAASQRRTLNGSERGDKTLRLQGNSYQLNNGGKKTNLAIYPIRQTMITLYLQEPLHFNQVYSDAFERLLPVQKVAPHHYRVRLPDGNYSDFLYQNGQCVKVHVNHKLYKAVLELNK